MAPKLTPNPQKAAAILAYFHQTSHAHSIKVLEKTLPQIASISGMHVKDYLGALADDNKIRVEKIGSGNWYWSFPSDEKKTKEAALCKATDECARADAALLDLQAKVDAAGAARAEDEDMLMETGDDRQTLIARHADLTRQLDELRTELAAYSEQDPVEMEKKAAETRKAKANADRYTDHIYAMESWIREAVGGDRERMLMTMKMLYEDEYDDEEQGLREL